MKVIPSKKLNLNYTKPINMFTIKETNVTIMVRDMNASIKFYELLGLKLKNRWGDSYAQLSGPDIIIGLHPAREARINESHVSIGFIVDDLNEVKKQLSENQLAFELSNDKAGSFAHLKDPDGTIVYFMQPTMQW